jgi:hypothetical protein
VGTGEAVVTAGVEVEVDDGDGDGDTVDAAGVGAGAGLLVCPPVILAVASSNPTSNARVTAVLVLMIILLLRMAQVSVERGPLCRRSDAKESPAIIVKVGIRALTVKRKCANEPGVVMRQRSSNQNE